MRRLILLLLLCLVLGASSNVLVAWIAAARSEQLMYERDDERPATAEDLPGYLATFWPPPVRYREAVGLGFGVSMDEMVCTEISPASYDDQLFAWNEGPMRAILIRVRFGWPMRSMSFDSYGLQGELSKESKGEFFDRCERAAGMRAWRQFPKWTPISPRSRRGVPRAILPLGFVANTAGFSTVFAFLLGIRSIRNWIRRNRGLCPHCAYPVSTSCVCTECGKPVKSRAAAA
jgi:hypothetical protein